MLTPHMMPWSPSGVLSAEILATASQDCLPASPDASPKACRIAGTSSTQVTTDPLLQQQNQHFDENFLIRQASVGCLRGGVIGSEGEEGSLSFRQGRLEASSTQKCIAEG
jgi:hypothetical protein